MLNKLCHLMVKYNGGENCVDPDQLADLGLYFLKKNILTGKFCSSHAAFGLNCILLSVKPNILEGTEYENMSTQLHYINV